MTAPDLTTVDGLLAALELPGRCRVDQRVPKKLLVDNGAPTTADKRLINDGIEEIHWVAALKPNTVGVSVYRDDLREYLEIAVLTVTLRATDNTPARAARLAELVHRAVPYPVLLLLYTAPRVALSLAHKRWAHNEAGKVVLDGPVVAVTLPDDAPSTTVAHAFTRALSLSNQPQSTLYGLYQGWMDSLYTLQAAKLTGTFQAASGPEQATRRRQALQECERLEQEATGLRKQAAKESQLARRVELNLALQRVQAQLAAARQQL